MRRMLWKRIIGRAALGCLCCLVSAVSAAEESQTAARRVMAFYYPWYGTADGAGGAGRTIHWGQIDAAGKTISESTHYPLGGAYDSHERQVVERHCRQAAENGIDTLIVSWWGAGSYEDRAMPLVLELCERFGLKATVYYEAVPAPPTPETAAKDIAENILAKYADHPAWLKHGGRPVVFVYGRAVQQLGLYGWYQVKERLKTVFPQEVALIGDDWSYGAATVFDGLHTYNTAGMLQGKTPEQVRAWCARTYPEWIQTARRQGKIAAVTVIPGYDDTKIRTPGLKVERWEGALYAAQWQQAVQAAPDWIVITSFNEWHEGSEIEPSVEYGTTYLKMTRQYAEQFLKLGPSKKEPPQPALPPTVEKRLREKLAGLSMAVLPEPSSTPFWWLLHYKPDLKVLSWDEAVGGLLKPETFSIVLYCGGETYRTTVRQTEDVPAVLEAYGKGGGVLAALSSEPWPFYYDTDGRTVNHAGRFGITLKIGWEKPPPGKELFFVPSADGPLMLADEIPFAAEPDPRWRPFVRDSRHTEYCPLLRLKDRQGIDYGDGLVIARTSDGGTVVYGWFGLFRPPHEEAILANLFLKLAERIEQPAQTIDSSSF